MVGRRVDAAGHALDNDVAQRLGFAVYTRVLASLLPLMEVWLQVLVPREPFATPVHLPADAEGCGLNEAARGALGHWLRIEGGRIANDQIVAPTSWNFSPRDASGLPGPLEPALAAAPVRAGEATPVAVQHIVHSFDPCMVCAVH